MVEEQLVQEAELVRLRRARYIPDIPDTLYMVEDKPRPMGAVGVDILAAALPGIQPSIYQFSYHNYFFKMIAFVLNHTQSSIDF